MSATTRLRVLVLATAGTTTKMLIHALASQHTVVCVVIEEKEHRIRFLRRRARRLGWCTVIGQVLFMLFVPPLLIRFARARMREIEDQYGLVSATAGVPIVHVHSVNSDDVVAIVQREHPDAVVVHGTRIVSSKVLAALSPIPFYNIHAGITPRYRGVHGGYWALARGEPTLFGATVHRVDSGIDTGEPLAYAFVQPTVRDTFVTYPLLQFGAGLRALLCVLQGTTSPPREVVPTAPVLYHPTLWGYLATYLRRGVR